MLPIVDYGGIAIVIPKVTAVGSVIEEEDKFGFEVYLTGMNDPLVIGFDSRDEAVESRNELIAIIARYHYVRELGPDYDIEDMAEEESQDTDDTGDTGESEKH
jgi:hypothetical protein